MHKIIGALVWALAFTLVGCSNSTPDGGEGPKAPREKYVESQACRNDAAPLVDALALIPGSGSIEAIRERLAAVDTSATAQCTEAVARPIRDAIESLKCVDLVALSLPSGEGCRSVGQSLKAATAAVSEAREALSARE